MFSMSMLEIRKSFRVAREFHPLTFQAFIEVYSKKLSFVTNLSTSTSLLPPLSLALASFVYSQSCSSFLPPLSPALALFICFYSSFQSWFSFSFLLQATTSRHAMPFNIMFWLQSETWTSSPRFLSPWLLFLSLSDTPRC